MSDGEAMLWISAPRGGASADAGWQWVDGELVYTARPRWVQTGTIERGGAVRAEVVADFQHVSGIGRQHRSRWSDLRAEIAGEFEQFTTREDDLRAVIDRRCSKLARQVAGRARVGRLPQKQKAFQCWVCSTVITTRASHRSYCSRKCRRKSYHARGGRQRELAAMRQWRAKKASDVTWRRVEAQRKREAGRRCERKQRQGQLAQRAARQCPECATQFVPLNAKRVYCTELCRVRSVKRRYWRTHKERLSKVRNARRVAARVAQRRAA
jgi:hypothetical protein